MERLTASDQIFRTLRSRILSLELTPGSELNVQGLADELGVSKSPVRDALLKLKEVNLVEIIPQSSTRVSLIDMEQVRVERFLRTSLESDAAYRFCLIRSESNLAEMELAIEGQKNAWKLNDMALFLENDDTFHSVIFSGMALSRLWDIIQGQSGNYHRIRLLSFSVPDVCPDLIEKHLVMLDAFRNHDSAKVSALEETHMSKLDTEADALQKAYPAYFTKMR